MSTGRANIRLDVTSEKNVTINELVKEADQMWQITKGKNLKIGDEKSTSALMNDFRETNPQICQSYPIVLRYMVEMQEYTSKAFFTYLQKINSKPWKNEEEYLDSQADYVVILYKDIHPRWKTNDVNQLWKNIRDSLKKETEVFKKYLNEADQEITAQENNLKMESLKELKDFIMVASKTIETKGGKIWCETELPWRQIVVPHIDDISYTGAGMQANELLN